MKKIIYIILLGFLVLFRAQPVSAAAGINQQINFQGKIVSSTGTNISDGTYDIEFKVHNHLSNTGGGAGACTGSCLWRENQTGVTVTNGIFRVALGSVTSFGSSVDWNSDALYLSIRVNTSGQTSEAEMSPRIRFASVPQAFNAQKVAGLTVTDTTGTLTIPDSTTVSFGGAFTTSGASALILTTSGTTNVTLPTTGTLLTNTASAVQTVTSTQTGGTVLGISDSTGLASAVKGLVITLSGTNAFDQTGLEFNLSNASGSNLNDIVGSGSTWKVSKSGALTVSSCSGCGAGAGSASQWQLNSGVISAYDPTQSLSIGGTATTSAKLFFDGTTGLIYNPSSTFGGDDTPGSVGINDIFVVTATSSAYSAFNLDAKTGQAALSIIQRDSGGDLFTASASSTTKVVINNTGSVGIGNSAPVALLDLSGAIKGKALTILNETGDQNIISASASGSTVFTLARGGGITTFGSSADIVKSTTGTASSTDFSKSGSTLTNVTSSNNQLSLDDCSGGPCSGSGTVSTSTVATSVNIGAGSFTIMREDGKFIIAHGGNVATGSIWDGSTTGAMSSAATNPGNATGIQAGAIALRRPDKRYLVVHGGAATSSTLFDPMGITASGAGPTLTSCTATTGTNAFMRDDGSYVIICGGSGNWGVYNPTANSYTAGSALGSSFGAGAFALRRDDGQFLVFLGGNTSTHYLYNSYANTWSSANPISSNPPTVTTGGVAIRRIDGKYLIIGGAQDASTIYDPTPTTTTNAGTFTAQSGVGYGPTAALADGSFLMWRPDNKYVLAQGGSTTTYLVDPSKSDNTQFAAGPALQGTSGAGGHAFMRPDGQYQIFRGGGASTVSDTYNNISYIVGGNGSGQQLASYETECITNSNLNPLSSLRWNPNGEGLYQFQVKTGTGSCSSTYRDVGNPGDKIGALPGNDSVQIKVFFKRYLATFNEQDWGMRKGLSQVQYRMRRSDPVIYDLIVDTSNLVKQNWTEFGISSTSASPVATDPSGPLAVNVKNTNTGVTLAASDSLSGLGNTILTVNSQFYPGAFGSQSVLATNASAGGILMQRPDRKFVWISGTSAANAQLYDQDLKTFTALGTTPTAQVGPYALAYKRPDGKFLIVTGNNTTTTNIFDPVSGAFTLGPVTTAVVGEGSLLIPTPNGKLVIVHGNRATSTSIYDPMNNQMYTGPATTAAVGLGSLAIPRPDGTFLLVLGMNAAWCGLSTTTNTFNPFTMSFIANTGVVMTTGTGPGAHAFQRSDGLWVIVHGAGSATCVTNTNRTQIYNPFTNQAIAGPTLSALAGPGAMTIPRPDGTFLIIHGGGLTTTTIYNEKGGTAGPGVNYIGSTVVGPAVVTAVSNGGLTFQRDDGRFVVVTGNNGAVVQQYDGGWVNSGTYRTEVMNINGLDSTSTLSWSANSDIVGISGEVRTASSAQGLQTAVQREVVNGGLISPSTGETYLQVNFNMKRTFPSYNYGGHWDSTWYSGSNVPQRKILMPTLTGFRVAKDSNLLNLTADGMSYFRVNSNGDVFTSPGAAINSGGADLAENYTSDEFLDKGEVVSLDSSNNHGVKKSLYQYQSDILGVVSTAPGFVAGSHTDNSYPIALVGRVPVKVTTENGAILAGDRITASSVPGFAMKALKAGRVLGVAMENLDQSKLSPCPESAFVAERKCGLIMVFVNLTDYLGTPVAVAMASGKNGTFNTQINQIVDQNGTTVLKGESVLDNLDQKQKDILDFLREQKNLSSSGSEVFADRVSATNEIITPQLIADLIVAKKIKADSIEGLELLVSNIKNQASSEELSSYATSSGQLATVSGTVNDKLKIESGLVTLDFSVMGRLSSNGGLLIVGPAEFRGNSFFYALATFVSKVVFKDNVNFIGQVTFNSDTAGHALIKKDQQRVHIKFENKYENVPIITANLVNVRGENVSDQEWNNDLDKRFGQNYQFVIAGLNNEGFEIILNKKAQEELNFSWNAIAVKDAKTFESESTGDSSKTISEPLQEEMSTQTLGTSSATTADSDASSSGKQNE